MLVAVLSLLVASVQEPVKFPESFVGEWNGEMLWSQVGKLPNKPIPMSLTILKTEEDDVYDYKIIYNNTDSRPYLLKPVNKSLGHWVIDEQNGAVLDCFWVGGLFASTFEVGKSTLSSTLRFRGEKLIWEVISYESGKLGTMNVAGNEISTRKILSTQYAELTKSSQSSETSVGFK